MDCFEKYYALNRKMLSFVGLWPKLNPQEVNLRAIAITSLLPFIIVNQAKLLYTSDFTLDSIIKPLYTLLPGLCTMACYYTVLYKSTEVKMVINHMRSDWHVSMSEQEFRIMKKYANKGTAFSLFLVCVFFCYIILFLSPSILSVFIYTFGVRNDTKLILPIPSSFPIDTNTIYYSVLLYQICLIFIITTIAASIYTTYMLCVQHACTLFSVIIARINRPFQNDRNYDWLADGVKDSYEWIVDITKRYEKAIKFVDLINALSEIVYLAEMSLAMLLIIMDFLYLFQISSIMQNMGEALPLFIYVPGSITVLYMNCHLGQRLIDRSLQIFEASSYIPFYDIPVKCHKPLLLLIMRSMKPCKLSIGGIFASSHYFFAGLMQKSYTYAMVCYTMR